MTSATHEEIAWSVAKTLDFAPLVRQAPDDADHPVI